jgi:hypothetical protein
MIAGETHITALFEEVTESLVVLAGTRGFFQESQQGVKHVQRSGYILTILSPL